MTSRRIGLLGGTFDPIHAGHLDLAAAAETALMLTQILVIPANVPPHRPKPLTSTFHRFAMAALAVAGRRAWRVSDVELLHEAPSYTATTLRRFHERGYDPRELFFVIGADAFRLIATWRDFPSILDRAHFAVVSRPQHPVSSLRQQLAGLADRMVDASDGVVPERPSITLIDATTADVSSTAIRASVARGERIDGLVDARVQQHIEQHGLYRSGNTDRRSALGHDTPSAGRLHGQD